MSPNPVTTRRTPRVERGMLAVGGALMALCVVGGVVLRAGPAPWQGWDEEWLDGAIGNPALTDLGDRVALWFAAVGAGGLLSISLLLLATLLVGWRRGWRTALLLPVAAGVTLVLTSALKAWVGRGRPEEMLIDLSSMAYPSGHSSQAAAFATALLLAAGPAAWRRWWPVAAFGVIGMAWSRTHLAVHWLSDTIGGIALGVGLALVAGSLLLPWARGAGRDRTSAARP